MSLKDPPVSWSPVQELQTHMPVSIAFTSCWASELWFSLTASTLSTEPSCIFKWVIPIRRLTRRNCRCYASYQFLPSAIELKCLRNSFHIDS